MQDFFHPRSGLPSYLIGFRVYPVRESHGFSRRAHRHPFWELHYCEKGNGFFYVDGQRYPVRADCLTLLYGPVHHSLRCTDDSVYRRTVVHFPLALPLAKYERTFYEILPLIPTKEKPCLQFYVPQTYRAELQALLSRAFEECNDWRRETPSNLSHVFSDIIHILRAARPYRDRERTQAASPYEELFVSRVENMITNATADEPPTVTSLSKQLQVSPGHIRRVYSKARQRTLREFLIGHKLSRALSCLRSGGTVTEAAVYSYYDNVGSFSRAFREYIGVSPSIFRAWVTQL